MKKVLKKSLDRTRHHLKTLPDKKQYVEFLTAILSVPVLLTVILVNYNNLRPKSNSNAASPTPGTIKEYIYTTPGDNQNTLEKNPGQSSCKPSIPPVSIDSPSENDTVNDNPVLIQISYDQGNYCSLVWSYRVNGGSWSAYDNSSISLYNLPQGQITFDLRVKSLASNSSTSLTRHFTYTGSYIQVTPTNSPVSSSSAH
jgi:hypothetical protein